MFFATQCIDVNSPKVLQFQSGFTLPHHNSISSGDPNHVSR